MRHLPLLITLCAPVTAMAGDLAASVEQFNYQTGSSSLQLRSYDAFDELSDVTVFPGVTGLALSVNQGPLENIAFNPSYDAFKRRQSWASIADMVAARPTDATFTYTLTGTPSGNVTIQGPGVDYLAGVPDSPIFNFGDTPGYWTVDSEGRGIFNVDATKVGNSFTVTLNDYTVKTQGQHRFSAAWVADIAHQNTVIDEAFSMAEGHESLAPVSFTFTRGLALNGGDSDPSTYGFEIGSLFELEGEFGNMFGLADAGLGDDHFKSFIYQNNTTVMVRVVPEPSAWLLFLAGGGLMLGLRSLSRHKALPA